MYEITFGSRTFCGFLKFRPNLQFFGHFAFSSGHVAILCYPPQPLQSLCPCNIWFWPIHKSKFLMKRVSFCHSRKFIPKISQNLRKSFCQRKFLPLCPRVLISFSIYLLLTYDYPCTEMSFMPYSITNSIKIT